MWFLGSLIGALPAAIPMAATGGDRGTFYVCHCGHENDRVYAENVLEYLGARGIRARTMALPAENPRSALARCLEGPTLGVLGFNAQLDNSWLASGSFIALAERRRIPVIQWLLDHPARRWHQFEALAFSNCRYVFNTASAEAYFRRYCKSTAQTAVVTGVGPNHRSRTPPPTRNAFDRRPIACLIPINLWRGETLKRARADVAQCGSTLSALVEDVAVAARHDLDRPLEVHLAAALAGHGRVITNQTFHSCMHVAAAAVQEFRRRRIFAVARDYPGLIQSDSLGVASARGGHAETRQDVGMRETLLRLRSARAVLSVSPLHDEIHDRTLNGLNAGCVNIVEDNAIHRAVFKHGEDALLFRYHDDSLRECLDVVCNDPDRAYRIACAGLEQRDRAPFRFGNFGAIYGLTGAQRLAA
jgi:hypothetical protein